ncbi:hypothetical protein C8J57DRAFT_1247201 [Mycena rebaudengoi]|nr:hypothetical protein C8J57DRAFT_1247201 [Mycena rebaudengoi]
MCAILPLLVISRWWHERLHALGAPPAIPGSWVVGDGRINAWAEGGSSGRWEEKEKIHQLYETVDEDEMDVIHASFCARFLPALVDAYKSVPDLLGQYTTMLRVVSSSGYFAKFMRGALGSDIYTIHAERFVEMKLSADIDFEAMESAVIMLVFLIVYSDHYHRTIPPLAEPLKEKLTAKMVTLQNHYGPKLKQVAVRRGQVASRRARLLESIVRNAGDAERFLTGRLASANMLGAVGRMMPWVTCGGYDTGCRQAEGPPRMRTLRDADLLLERAPESGLAGAQTSLL